MYMYAAKDEKKDTQINNFKLKIFFLNVDLNYLKIIVQYNCHTISGCYVKFPKLLAR